MTMPHLMNCDHSPEGWCLDCVKSMYDALTAELARRDSERTEAERGWALLQGLGMDAAVVRLLDGWSAKDSTAQWRDAPTLLAALEAAAGDATTPTNTEPT